MKSLAIGDDQARDAVCVVTVDSGAVYHDSYRSNLDVASLTNMRVLYDSLSAKRSFVMSEGKLEGSVDSELLLG